MQRWGPFLLIGLSRHKLTKSLSHEHSWPAFFSRSTWSTGWEGRPCLWLWASSTDTSPSGITLPLFTATVHRWQAMWHARQVARKRLQLCGVAAMFIAAKFEEPRPSNSVLSTQLVGLAVRRSTRQRSKILFISRTTPTQKMTSWIWRPPSCLQLFKLVIVQQRLQCFGLWTLSCAVRGQAGQKGNAQFFVDVGDSILGPTAAHFLDRFVRANHCPEAWECAPKINESINVNQPFSAKPSKQEQSHLMHYLAELSLLEVQMLQYTRWAQHVHVLVLEFSRRLQCSTQSRACEPQAVSHCSSCSTSESCT